MDDARVVGRDEADQASTEADVMDDARVVGRDEADQASTEADVSTTNEHTSAIAFSSRGNTKWIVVRGPLGRAFDRLLVRFTGFSVITWQYSKAGGNAYQPTLLLTTIGRKSGKLRTRALPYYSVEEGRWVVIGSNGGGPRDPDWAWNVRANSAAWVCVRRRRMPARAHIAAGAERQRIFDAITAQRDSLARYQERASTFGREVPLVVLEPISPPG